MSQEDCIFCRIIAGDIPSKKVYEDDVCIAFHDLSPQAPVHILVVPREHLASLAAAREQHRETLGHLLLSCGEIARGQGLADAGYRVVINTGELGGQTVHHLHVHLLGGRQFIFPPG
jgi:histidine triad (HIT) family protein